MFAHKLVPVGLMLAALAAMPSQVRRDPQQDSRPQPTPVATEITNSIGMKLAYIPAGKFFMGSPQEEIDRLKAVRWEGPRHEVEISKGYYIGIHEVTIGQLKQFVAEQGYRTESEKDGQGGSGYNANTKKWESRKPEYTWKNTGWALTDEHPVVNVTWNDAKAFCAWLSKREKKTYSLPSEAQWEYACRAGTNTPYYIGADPESLVQVGNVADADYKTIFLELKDPLKARDGYIFTAPVGRFKKNNFGLYDMHGNVWEWCEDGFDVKYYANSPRVDPVNTKVTDYRTLRGGAWNSAANLCRSARRNQGWNGSRSDNFGFRIVQVSP